MAMLITGSPPAKLVIHAFAWLKQTMSFPFQLNDIMVGAGGIHTLPPRADWMIE